MTLAISREDAKKLATLKAQAALHGIVLSETEDDRGQPLFVITKWALCRSYETLDQTAAMLDAMTGKSPAPVGA